MRGSVGQKVMAAGLLAGFVAPNAPAALNAPAAFGVTGIVHVHDGDGPESPHAPEARNNHTRHGERRGRNNEDLGPQLVNLGQVWSGYTTLKLDGSPVVLSEGAPPEGSSVAAPGIAEMFKEAPSRVPGALHVLGSPHAALKVDTPALGMER